MSTTAPPHVAEAGRRTRHPTQQASVRELDDRVSDGLGVTLRWDPLRNGVSIVVRDDRLGDSSAFEVDPADALCAFHHPYACATTSQSQTGTRPMNSCLNEGRIGQ